MAVELRTLAAESGWIEEALPFLRVFHNALPQTIKGDLVSKDEASHKILDEIIYLSGYLD